MCKEYEPRTGIEISGGPSARDDSFCVGPADRYLSESTGPVDFGGALRFIRLVHYTSLNCFLCSLLIGCQGSRRVALRKSTRIRSQVTHNNYQLGVLAYANFPKLYPSRTILSVAVSVYYIFDT